MKFFDFADEVEQAQYQAVGEIARLSAKTAVHRAEFPAAVKRAGFRFLSRGSLFEPGANDLVIGAAPWSDSDLEALEDVAAQVRRDTVRVSVYDVDDLGFPELANLFPGIPRPMRTPIVIHYRDGRLTYFGDGKDAVLWLRQV